jgi:hypothetical protein
MEDRGKSDLEILKTRLGSILSELAVVFRLQAENTISFAGVVDELQQITSDPKNDENLGLCSQEMLELLQSILFNNSVVELSLRFPDLLAPIQDSILSLTYKFLSSRSLDIQKSQQDGVTPELMSSFFSLLSSKVRCQFPAM